jgi:actin-like ATPase involved in cell morphogenesis
MRLRAGVAIDLGTVNTLVYVAGRGLVIDDFRAPLSTR